MGGSFLDLCCVILQVLCHPPGFDFCPDDETSQEEIKSAKGKEYLLSEYIYIVCPSNLAKQHSRKFINGNYITWFSYMSFFEAENLLIGPYWSFYFDDSLGRS